jgi:hypothetical protein
MGCSLNFERKPASPCHKITTATWVRESGLKPLMVSFRNRVGIGWTILMRARNPTA